jgi:hypothetical protein
MGYSSAASAVLLALYGDKARDVSSKQASYHYIQVNAEVSVRHGHILLKVTDAELARAEALTRQSHRPAVYRWRDGAWLELPKLNAPDYTPIMGRSGPTFNPTGMQIVAAATGEAEAAIQGITVEKSQRSEQDIPWYWLRGDTYPHRELLKRWGCRWSKKRKAWYYKGQELPGAVQQLIDTLTPDDDAPCSDDEAERILGVRLAPRSTATPSLHVETSGDEQTIVQAQAEAPPTDALPDEPAEPQHIRVLKPQPLPVDGTPLDEVQSAVVQARANPVPALKAAVHSQKRTLVAIGQSYVGELTGSITGNVYCYGYAIHEGVCVFVNMGGPRMAVEAIRAKLSKGDIVNCVPWDAPAVELTAGEGNTGMYQDYFQNIPEAKFTSLILCHDLLINPNYGGKSTTFILRTDEAQAAAKLRQHVTELVKVPVFDDWTGYLYHAGQTAMLVRQTRIAGDIDLLTVDLDVDAWTRLITGGLEQGVLSLPQDTLESNAV